MWKKKREMTEEETKRGEKEEGWIFQRRRCRSRRKEKKEKELRVLKSSSKRE